ncbi:DUF6308 family protein [Geodermatophilus sp. SYSU D00705]
MRRRRRPGPGEPTDAAADRSIRDLEACAAGHIAHYTAPQGPRAFHTYDHLGTPDALHPLDCLAPALLSTPASWKTVVPLFQPEGPGAELRKAMQAVLDAPASSTTDFLAVDLDNPPAAWAAVDVAVEACRTRAADVSGFKESSLTKTLHRKRPTLVPIFDSEVYAFYFGHKPRFSRGRDYTQAARALWRRQQADLGTHWEWIAGLGRGVRTPDGRPISVLRTADIVIWEHQIGCPSPRV